MNAPNLLDPASEFDDGVAEAEAAAAAKAEAEKAAADRAAAEKATHDRLAAVEGTLAEKLKEIDGLKSKTAIVDRLQEVLGSKPEDPKDKYITDEIRRRLGGDLEDLAKIRAILPAIMKLVEHNEEEKLASRVSSAQEVLAGEMKKAGLDVEDEDVASYVEEAVTAEIRRNPELMELWESGKNKQAVSKAFQKVNSKLFAPLRASVKRAAVNTVINAPKASPKGGAPGSASEGTKSVDTRDTSREGISKVHDAAWERLQQLLDE